jgi:hypothetical protein
MGHPVRVRFPYVFTERGDCHALACINTDQIYISSQDNDEPLTEAKIAENFLHEIAHYVSQTILGDGCIGGNEVAHGLFCRMLFQIIRDNHLEFNDRSDPVAKKKKGKGCK